MTLVLALALAACGKGDDSGSARVSDILALTGDPTNGAALYADNCARCHGDDGSGEPDALVDGGSITGVSEKEEVVEETLNGNDEGMPSFGADLEDQDIADIAAYVTESL